MFNKNNKIEQIISASWCNAVFQLPLDSVNPIDTDRVVNTIAANKDVDG